MEPRSSQQSTGNWILFRALLFVMAALSGAAGSFVTQHDVQHRVEELERSNSAVEVRSTDTDRRVQELETHLREHEIFAREAQLHIEKMLARVCAKLNARCED